MNKTSTTGKSPDGEPSDLSALAEALRDTTAALNSTLHFDEVLDRILTNVGHVVPHDSADIMLLESGIARVVRSRGYVERGLETSVLAVRLTVEDVPILRQMAETGQPLTVPDTQAFPDWVDIPQTRWVRSYAGAPIHVKGQTLGFLNLASAMPGFFTPAHAERLQAFADQAAVAIENARLFQAAQRRLDEQTALLAASTAITSSLDFATVLNRLAQQMGQAINATSVYICDWNPLTGTSTVLAEYYSPEAAPEESVSDLGVTYSVSRDLDENLIEQLLAGKVLVVHADDPDLSEPTRAHMVRYAGRSRILVPLIVKEIVIGHVELWESRRRRDFTDQESALCQGIAQQAAIALENTRLFEAEHLRRQEIETVLQASLSLTASLDLPQVFDAILSAMLRLVPAYDTHIFLFSEGRLTFGAAMTLEGRLTQPLSEPRSDSVTYTVARSGEPLVVEDARQHPMFTYLHLDWQGAIIGLPLKIGATVVGVMNVAYRQPHRFSESEQRVLSLLAAQAAVAIQNARLHEQVQRHADELDRRVAERTAELERERRRSQAILDAADEGMVFTDRDWTIEYVNPAIERITGYTAVEALGRTPRLWQSDLTPPAVYDDMKRARSTSARCGEAR